MTADGSILCLACCAPTGVPPLDPAKLPAGVRAGLVALCASCADKARGVRPHLGWRAPWVGVDPGMPESEEP